MDGRPDSDRTGEVCPDAAGDAVVGRGAELRLIGEFVDGVPAAGGTLVISGDPGAGKTTLLCAAVRDARAAGIRVLHTVGVQFRSQVGYGALKQLLVVPGEAGPDAAAAPALAAALGSGRGTVPSREAVANAVVALVTELSRDVPTLLVVDDVQWLDGATATVLALVARSLLGSRAGMLCAARKGEDGFFDYTNLPTLELGPLSEQASEELLIRSFPALAAQVRQRLIAEAEGNPLALLELPTTLSDAQRTASRALPNRIPLTRRLQSAFASRIEGLPAATRHLLLVAALEGTGNLPVIRNAVSGRCGLKHLAPAERAGLVQVDETTGRLGFRHSLVRSVVVDLSDSDQRRNVHRTLAEAWRGVPEQRAWHLARAAVDPDEQVAALLEEVSDTSARRGDGPNAVAALVRAADLSPEGTEQARRLAKAAYVGAILTGELRDVPRLLDDAKRVAPDADSPAAAVAAAIYLLNSYGDFETAHRLLHGAIARVPEPYDLTDGTLIEAVSTLFIVCVHAGRTDFWQAYDEVLSHCTSVPDTLRLLRATFADPARAEPSDWARLDAAVAALPGSSDPGRIVKIATAGAYADRLGAMDQPLRHTARGGRTGENHFPAIQASFLWGSHAYFTGQWQELRTVVENGLALCEQYDYPLRSWTGKWVLACVSAVCGDHARAERLADQMDQWAGARRGHAVRCYAAHARALSALSQGDFEAAYQYAGFITPAGSFAPFAGHALWAMLDQVEATVRTGRVEQAREHVRAARDAGLDEVSPRLRMVVLASAALAARSDDEALALFQEALAVEEAERWPFDFARIQLYLAERLRRSKEMGSARRYLSSAAAVFSRLGAVPWAERANKELRACGSPVRPHALDDVVLTPQQWEIAGLAASGLTNKQIGERLFLSPRTVSSHLYQVFPKLGVTSRAGLRDALTHLERT
jgi:DNA-binding CsgD family transcriptional regulator